jgi:hypothetical protein
MQAFIWAGREIDIPCEKGLGNEKLLKKTVSKGLKYVQLFEAGAHANVLGYSSTVFPLSLFFIVLSLPSLQKYLGQFSLVTIPL